MIVPQKVSRKHKSWRGTENRTKQLAVLMRSLKIRPAGQHALLPLQDGQGLHSANGIGSLLGSGLWEKGPR